VTAPFEAQPKKRSRLGLYVMPAILVLLAISVSIWWVVATRFADSAFDHWLANEASAGRQWSCATRNMAGFPFRIELSCEGLTLVASKGEPRALSIGGFVAVAQIYQPSLILVETHGPMHATLASGQTLSGQWTMMRSSLHFETPSRADRVAWVVEGLTTEGTLPFATSTIPHAEFHLRKIPLDSGLPEDSEIAVSVKDAVFRDTSSPASFDSRLTIKKGVLLMDNPGPAGVEAWRSAGGEVGIDRWDLKRGDQALAITGALSLDETHRLSGKIDFAAKGIGDVLKEIGLNALAGVIGSGSVKLPLAFNKGRLLLGPLKLAELPPLY